MKTINNYKILIMRTIKTLSIITVLFFAFTVSSQAQGLKFVKIKTSAQTELCKMTIENSLEDETGINAAVLDLETKILTVKYSDKKTDYDKISDAIVNLGYDADDKKADKNAYSKLPDECKKPLTTKSDCGSKYKSKSDCSKHCSGHK